MNRILFFALFFISFISLRAQFNIDGHYKFKSTFFYKGDPQYISEKTMIHLTAEIEIDGRTNYKVIAKYHPEDPYTYTFYQTKTDEGSGIWYVDSKKNSGLSMVIYDPEHSIVAFHYEDGTVELYSKAVRIF